MARWSVLPGLIYLLRIIGLAGIIPLTVTVVDLVEDVEFGSLRKGLLLAATAPPLALATVFLVRRLRSGHVIS